MLVPRTIRLDGSDLRIFEKAAEPGEIAVSGAFWFDRPHELSGKDLQAFAHGFLGLDSFGWSTLAVVTSLDAEECKDAVEALGRMLCERFGAPGMEAARAAARDEIEFASGLCEHPVNTLLSVSRSIGEDGIVEKFGAFARPGGEPVRTWHPVADDAV